MSTNFNKANANIGTTSTTIYTAPAQAASSVVYGFTVANTIVPESEGSEDILAAQRYLTLNIHAAGGALQINKGTRIPIPPGSVLNLAPMKITLKPGESIRALADDTGLAADVAVLENLVDEE